MADAVESLKAGFKATHLRNNVESAARIKMNRPETLADFPSRVLLQMLGRNAPTPPLHIHRQIHPLPQRLNIGIGQHHRDLA